MNRSTFYAGLFVILLIFMSSCQSMPQPEFAEGLGTKQVYSTSVENAFRKAQRALELEGVQIISKDEANGFLVGQFGGSAVWLGEPRSSLYVYVRKKSLSEVEVEFFSKGHYAEKLEKTFFKNLQKIIAGSLEY